MMARSFSPSDCTNNNSNSPATTTTISDNDGDARIREQGGQRQQRWSIALRKVQSLDAMSAATSFCRQHKAVLSTAASTFSQQQQQAAATAALSSPSCCGKTQRSSSFGYYSLDKKAEAAALLEDSLVTDSTADHTNHIANGINDIDSNHNNNAMTYYYLPPSPSWATLLCGLLLLVTTTWCHARVGGGAATAATLGTFERSSSSSTATAIAASSSSSSFHHAAAHQHQSQMLASAAISSIAETLSPILPFTGGIDLRREFDNDDDNNQAHWSLSSWWTTASNVVSHVQEAFAQQQEQMDQEQVVLLNAGNGVANAIPRGGSIGAASKVQKKQQQRAAGRQSMLPNHPLVLSSSKPFLEKTQIAQLTLTDLTQLFSHAMQVSSSTSKQGSSGSKADAQQENNEQIQYAIDAMDLAVQQSRGSAITRGSRHEPSSSSTPLTTTTTTTGDMDALYFCAVLRIFAEWRLLRQVPDGYKGYAVGMTLGHKDIVQNLAKLETAVHQWQREQLLLLNDASSSSSDHDDSSASVVANNSPTLRDLLEHEVERQVHTKLPRLKEKSAAMGLLWVRRQLNYQTTLFANILQVPSSKFPTTHAAVAHAYQHVYGSYHGWAVQKIFNYSFQAAPDVYEIYKFMNPTLLEQVQERAKREVYVDDVRVLMDSSRNAGTDGQNGKRSSNPMERLFHHVGSELDKFGKHLGGEWDKLVETVVRVFDQDASANASNGDAKRIRGGGGDGDADGIAKTTGRNNQLVQQQVMEEYVAENMAQDAHERIAIYLQQVEPLLDDLAHLFDDLNMDDPTKV